jgi:allantoicase
MGDGWETRRRRGPGYDWVILKLGLPGTIRRVIVDTAHFKGNYPDRCSLEACRLGPSEALSDSGQDSLAGPQVWKELLPETKLKPNARHVLSKLNDVGTATHVRFNIYPDGGVSRLRLFGQPISLESQAGGIANFNQLLREQARSTLLDCCGSHAWAEQMLAHMPFPDVAYALDTADKVWAAINHDDWIEAFRHHPAIGAKHRTKVQSATARRWSGEEQATAQKANAAIQSALVDANRSYQARFGHIFLICATGKTSDEILNTLQERMSNDPETELAIAAEEQHKITRLRLERILTS